MARAPHESFLSLMELIYCLQKLPLCISRIQYLCQIKDDKISYSLNVDSNVFLAKYTFFFVDKQYMYMFLLDDKTLNKRGSEIILLARDP